MVDFKVSVLLFQIVVGWLWVFSKFYSLYHEWFGQPYYLKLDPELYDTWNPARFKVFPQFNPPKMLS